MRPTWRRINARIRCLFGRHELVTDVVPVKPAGDGHDGEPARLRLRCLFCAFVSPGWEQGKKGYRQTYAGGPTAKDRANALAARNAADFGLARKRRVG